MNISRRSRRLTQIFRIWTAAYSSDPNQEGRPKQKRSAKLLRNLRETFRSTTLRPRWLLAFLLLSACVDRIYFDVPPPKLQTVVEGLISDGPGPYTVKVSRGMGLDAAVTVRSPIEKVKIKLYDDEGNVEDFTETLPGVYKTGNLIQGRIGHAYHIRLETPDGKVFESVPDRITPVGEVQEIRYEFEARTVEKSYGEVQADVFKIFVDATSGTGDENYVRWRFTGTYKVVTNPELHAIFLQCSAYLAPFPCSGYTVEPAEGGGKLLKVAECTCCTCWIHQFEAIPQVADEQFVSGNQFRNIKVGEAPINNITFSEGYMVEVEQMSLTKESFEFFHQIQTQKESASSLFQPPSGEIKGNVIPVNSSEAVIGLFWATSVNAKHLFIPRSAVPYNLTPMDLVTDPCTEYDNSFTEKPPLWP